MAVECNSAWKRQHVENMIATNDSELVAAEETAKRCRERQYELKTLLNSTTSVMSTLPREVLSEIFLAASYYPDPRYFNSHRLPTQFVIGKVCKAWRELAWATPRLWCQAFILLQKKRWETQKSLLEEWVARSGNCPLELNINVPLYARWEPPVDAFEVIINTCHRWRTLICGAFTSLSFALENEQNLQFPLLETLEIQLNHAIKAPLKKWNFHCPPRLKSLDIQGSLSDYGLAVNWNALTELSVDVVLGPRLAQRKACIPLKLLATCQSLVFLHCSLQTTIIEPTHIFHPTAICFPFLERLKLHALTCTTAQFMTMTKLPALKDLSLDTRGSTGPASPEDATWTTALIDWAKRSAFKLELLGITTDNLVEDSHIADMLRQLSPSHPIETLMITCSDSPKFHLSNNMIARLTMRPHKGVEHQKAYLPHLTHFVYRGNISFSTSVMICMLESRLAYAKLLKGDASDERSSEDEDGDDEDNEADEDKDQHEPIADEDMTDPPQEEDANEVSSSLGALEIDIEYANREWFQKQYPNRMRDFYRTVEEFENDQDGRAFSCEWEGCEDSDEE